MIRLAAHADAEEIALLVRLTRDTSLPYLPRLHTPAEDLAYFRDRVPATSMVRVAEQIDAVCACCGDWIDHLYARPTCHRQGLGMALLAHAMDGAPALRLWVFQRNSAAIAFYLARGFREIARTDGRDNEEREPDLPMTWTAP